MADFAFYKDETTGAQVFRLVTGDARNRVVGTAYPVWTPKLDYFVFLSDEGHRGGALRLHALCMRTGKTRRLVDETIAAATVSREHGRLQYVLRREILAVSMSLAFRNMASPRHVATLPDYLPRAEAGISLDAQENILYAGGAFSGTKEWGIAAYYVKLKTWRPVIRTDFPLGGVRANPVTPRIILFHDDSDENVSQRMWLANADGMSKRPFYAQAQEETIGAWDWWDDRRVLFSVQPRGVVSADMDSQTPTFHAQFDAQHVHGSPNGDWIAADDAAGNIWIIGTSTGERRLLTQGHSPEDHTLLPNPTFTPDSRAVLFNSVRFGVEEILLVMLPEWDSLPKADA